MPLAPFPSAKALVHWVFLRVQHALPLAAEGRTAQRALPECCPKRRGLLPQSSPAARWPPKDGQLGVHPNLDSHSSRARLI